MLHVICDVKDIVQYHIFALCQNLKLFLVNLHLKTLKTELKRF